MTDQLFEDFIKLLATRPITSTDAIRELECGRDDFYNKVKKAKVEGIKIISSNPFKAIYVTGNWRKEIQTKGLDWYQLMDAIIFVASIIRTTSTTNRPNEGSAQRFYDVMLTLFNAYDPEQFG